MRRRTKSSAGTVLHDFSFLMKVFMVLVLCIIMTLINPNKPAEPSTPSAGDIAVEAHWPDGLDVDVDLWVQGPEDSAPVGYSRRADKQFSYVRDDIGLARDSTQRNYEFSFSRGVAPGRYVINVHLYSGRSQPLPVPVRVVVTMTVGGEKVEVASREVLLEEVGQEQTAFSFELDALGRVIPGSVSTAYIRMRSGIGPYEGQYDQPHDTEQQ